MLPNFKFGNTQNVGWYPKLRVYPIYRVIPDTPGLPEISGNTRYFGLPATRWFSKLNRVGSGIEWNTGYRVGFGYPLDTAPPPWHVKCLNEMVILLGVYCVVMVQLKIFFWNFDFAHLKLSSFRGFVALLFSPTPDLRVRSPIRIMNIKFNKCEPNPKSPAGQTVRRNTWGNVHRLLTTLWGGNKWEIYISLIGCSNTCVCVSVLEAAI